MPSRTCLFLTALLLALLPGCAAPDQARGSARKAGDGSGSEDSLRPPTRGMTRPQVRARYGDPLSVTTTATGETWHYAFDRFGAKDAFIPFYATVHAHTMRNRSASIVFDGTGRVKNFTWREAPMHGF